MALPSAAEAETFAVDLFDDPVARPPTLCTPLPEDCSLRGAQEASDIVAGGDTIVLEAGEYVLREEVRFGTTARVLGVGARQTTVRSEQLSAFQTNEEEEGEPPFEFAAMKVTGVPENTGPAYGGGFEGRAPTILRRVAIVGNEDGADAGILAPSFPAWGGGVYTTRDLTVVDSLIAGNTAIAGPDGIAARGGGILVAGGETVVRNSTITGIYAIGGTKRASGAGISVTPAGSVKIESSTVAGNALNGNATSGGANIEVEPGGHVELRNSIVAGALPATAGDCLGATVSGGGNVFDVASCGGTGADRAGVDPLLGPLADNGGSTDTMALPAGSPAIDSAGSCGLATDQRGMPRTAPCDSGAFEAPATPVKPAGCTITVSGTAAKLEATVTCDEAATITVGGTATIFPKPRKKAAAGKSATASKKRKKRPKPVTLLTSPASTSLPGMAFRIAVTLPRRVRKAVRAGRRVSLDLILTARTSAGATSTATAHVKRVRKPPRKKPRRGSGRH
jgi:hypothetical protein